MDNLEIKIIEWTNNFPSDGPKGFSIKWKVKGSGDTEIYLPEDELVKWEVSHDQVKCSLHPHLLTCHNEDQLERNSADSNENDSVEVKVHWK